MYAHPHGNVFYRKMGRQRPKIAYGHGVYLYDEQGNRYLDGSGGALVVNIGHGRKEVQEAITDQLAAVAYVHATMFTSGPLEEYAAELSKIVPLSSPRFYLLTSGSEAVEAAIKLARQIQLARGEESRYLVIGRRHSYHGLSLGALSVSGRPSFRDPYSPLLLDMPLISPPYTYRDPVDGEEAAARLEAAILRYGPKRISAFIAEPISGASLGAAVPPHSYWPSIRQICDKYGLLLVADEVMVGFGRTGEWWGIDHWNVEPDIMVASKGAAGGYIPLAILATRGEHVDLIKQVFGDFNHGGTYSHHAVAAAAGLATLNVIRDENLVTRAAQMGELLGARLFAALGDHEHVGDIRGRGLLWGIELVRDREDKTPFPAEMGVSQNVQQLAFERGLILYQSQGCVDGASGDIILVGPPLIIKEDEVDKLVAGLGQAISALF
jgi:adenosylmethionine-8-amino-7-oxononanoate aminotransferase